MFKKERTEEISARYYDFCIYEYYTIVYGHFYERERNLLHIKKGELSDMSTEVVLNSVCKIKTLIERLDGFWDRNNDRKTELESLLNLI